MLARRLRRSEEVSLGYLECVSPAAVTAVHPPMARLPEGACKIVARRLTVEGFHSWWQARESWLGRTHQHQTFTGTAQLHRRHRPWRPPLPMPRGCRGLRHHTPAFKVPRPRSQQKVVRKLPGAPVQLSRDADSDRRHSGAHPKPSAAIQHSQRQQAEHVFWLCDFGRWNFFLTRESSGEMSPDACR